MLTSVKDSLSTLFRRGPKMIPYLDGLRALSILWVVLFHVFWFKEIFSTNLTRVAAFDVPLGFLFAKGSYGVDLFFVLSGFLISSLLFKEYEKEGVINLKKFYLRRALRLFPGYFLVLAIIKFLVPDNCHNVWANVFYVNNYLSLKNSCMGWSWSLAIEEQFYTIFPVFLIVLFKFLKSFQKRLMVFSSLFLVALLVVAGNFYQYMDLLPLVSHPGVSLGSFHTSFDTFYSKTHLRFGALVIGVLVGFLFSYKKEAVLTFLSKSSNYYSLFFLMIGLFIVTFVGPNGEEVNLSVGSVLYISIKRYVFSTGLGIMILLLARPCGPINFLNSFLSLKIWYPFSQLSYSFYLIHPLVLIIVYKTNLGTLESNFTKFALKGFFVSLFLSAVIYTLVERPFMNLREKFSH